MIIPSIPLLKGQVAGTGDLAGAAKKFSVVPTFHIDLQDEESIKQAKDTLSVYPGRIVVSAATDSADTILSLLDSYASVVVVPYKAGIAQVLEQLPKERVGVSLSVQQLKEIGAEIAKVAATLVVPAEGVSTDVSTCATTLGRSTHIITQWSGPTPTVSDIAALDKAGLDVLIGSPLHNGELDLGDAISAPLVSDREDGLYPTVVVDAQGVALGLVYSSKESIRESVKTGRGVYQSRKRGLWYKGDSSGAIQDLISIELDCDRDALKMVVYQHGAGFCHLETRSCFGAPFGIPALMRVLKQRKDVPVEKSYTQRLFKDPALLHAKILEEAQELCDAEDPEEIAWEAADVIYFSLVKCAAMGISLEDVERQLAQRQMKVTRRPGNAKPPQQPAPTTNGVPPPAATPAPAPAPTPAPAQIPKEVCLKKYDYATSSAEVRERLCKRPAQMDSSVINQRTQAILDDVRKRGDAAILEYTEKFDKAKLSSPVITLPLAQPPVLDPAVKAAIDQAFSNIYKFHQAQVPTKPLEVETQPGIMCSRVVRPIEKVGLYVPGGTAVLPSTALMLGIPAMVAGCKEIVVASPPRADGSLAPEILYIAEKVGASKILLAGGAQAIGAMAFGTQSVPKVDKICGPGNAYVTAAKMIVQNDSTCPVAIDMPAGPSEVLVICDAQADPEFVAIDLLSQAEHGVDSQVVLVAVDMSESQHAAIDSELERLTRILPREPIIRESLSKSYAVNVKSLEEAMAFSNQYGPEHLIVNMVEPRRALDLLTCAGSVFVGPYSPESCGDYASGTNHTLPTYGYARMYSGVSTSTFLNHITVQELTPEGLQGIGECVTTLAALEKLDAHRNAVVLRLNKLKAAA